MGERIRSAIAALVADEELSGEEAAGVAEEIMSDAATPAQIASFITALRLRGETVEHIVAFAKVMLEKVEPMQTPEGKILDIVGTGGDRAGTFNISTTAAFIAAGAGAIVAKHGNRSVSSVCGSADVLTALGVNVSAPIAASERCLREAGIAFLFAPTFHPAMKYAIAPRREIGIRTIFNLLGPLTNPARATHLLVGVYDDGLTELYAQVLRELGASRAMVVHGSDGLDEITTTNVTEASELKANGSIHTYVIDPNKYDLPVAEMSDLVGGASAVNGRIVLDILNGAAGPKTDIAMLNAAAAIYLYGLADSIEEGMLAARASIQSGSAREKLEQIKLITNETA
ncbi:MAG: anthranilate phosphoribosyltransferase [Candidatus Sumerlaeota bacterium]|nr:anthranilate phosphoribosyltransferase [Candidatus Sumerlaeota bacterium]